MFMVKCKEKKSVKTIKSSLLATGIKFDHFLAELVSVLAAVAGCC